MQHNFKGIGNSEYNDVEFDGEPLELTSSSYSFVIIPKCKFWRFGLRFGLFKEAGFSDTRYKNKKLRHIEVNAGSKPAGIWIDPHKLYLQEYFFHGPGSILKEWNTYAPMTNVTLNIQRQNDSWIFVSCESGGCPIYSITLPLKDHKFFKLFAWADNTDFEIDCEISKSMRIKLNQIKALTDQELEIEVKDLMIFFGPNNSGKSSIILGASHHFMSTGHFVMDYIGPNRFEIADTIDPKLRGRIELKEDRRKERNTYSQTTENKPIDPVSEFWLQDEATRIKISEWFALNFEELRISKKEIDEFSSLPEVTIDGRNPRLQGTGARMVLGIVVQLFCPDVKFLCIDEPELSLEPKAQKVLFDLIKKAAHGEDGVPKKQILIATHSHIFLDKNSPTNNYKVTKSSGKVSIAPIENESQLQDAVYNLLGNSPSDLFFPSNIIVVEGRSDQIFLTGIHELLKRNKLVGDKKIVFHFVDGINKAKISSIAITQMLKTQSYIPVYRSKICGLFDAPNDKASRQVIEEVRKYFNDDGSRFVTLSAEAIEYCYPLPIVQEIVSNYNLNKDELLESTRLYLKEVKSDKISHSGNYFNQKINKIDLAKKVASILLNWNDPSLIENSIVKLIIKADELSF